MTSTQLLLPEWTPQDAIILAWPDKQTDWAPWLSQARQTYVELMTRLNQQGTGVILLIRAVEIEGFKTLAEGLSKVLMIEADYNDTWVRDYGFLSCQSGQGMQPVEFNFNGWGNKFDATKDNLINRQKLAALCQLPLHSVDLVAEGGALEIDQQGRLLSTTLCLLNPARNGEFSLAEYQDVFATELGASESFFFEQGHLQGDDTDGHIDTLVRFTPDQGLVIQSAFNCPQDSHFDGLSALVDECRQALPEHKIFELPLPNVFSQDGERLPASYANYLINNSQVLCPVYSDPQDPIALEVIRQAYPAYDIVAVNCLSLVQQFGSLHCISMQIPCNTLRDDVLAQLKEGVSLWQ